jgi:predicted Zn-dependent protease
VAVTRRLFYDVAVTMLKSGRKKDARARLMTAIKREPTFARAWVRLAQSFL